MPGATALLWGRDIGGFVGGRAGGGGQAIGRTVAGVLVGDIGVGNAGRDEIAGGWISTIVDFIELEFFLGLRKPRRGFTRSGSLLNTPIGDDGDGRQDRDDHDHDQQFDNRESRR